MTISHNDRADWGHGPYPPIPVWTEVQIRTAMDSHRPANGDVCMCAWMMLTTTNVNQEFTVDHLIDKLKEIA
jgi:hypothetical protein